MIERIKIKEEEICLKKSFDGWRVIYPYKNLDGTKNWKNIITSGNYWKLIWTALILLLIIGITLSYMHDTRLCRETMKKIADNPALFCQNLTRQIITIPTINISNIKFK